MAGIGFGAMACAALIRPHQERLVIWLMPLCSIPALWSLSLLDGWSLVVMVGVCGVLLGLTMPVFISYGQELIPNGQRVASSITMGVSWGVAGGLVAFAFWAYNRADLLEQMFHVFCCSAAVSSMLCWWLPQSPAAKE